MKRVLIIRLDAIGDYVLWRNCLRFLRNHGKYSNAHLTVLGNPVWRNIAETLDGDLVDEWIWIEDRDSLFKKGWENLLPRCVWYRRVTAAQKRLKAKLSKLGFDEIVSPAAFTDPLLDEFVSGIAPVAISVDSGDRTRTCKFTRLLNSGKDSFVFYRNRSIVSDLAGVECDVQFELELNETPAKTNKILFFDSASHWTRCWPSRRWRKLQSMLPPGFEPVSIPRGRGLADFVSFVKSCAAVVSNDTMALHVAAALGVPVVGVVNGVSGKGAFWPYPSSLGKKVEVCIPKNIPSVPIPLLGSRIAQYLALSSVSCRMVADALHRALELKSCLKHGISQSEV